jgi:DNA-binding NtrC family response regulator
MTDSQAALALLASRAFDLVVTDVLMPAPDGFEVLMELRRHLPAVKVVVMSGGDRWGTATLLDIAHKLGAYRILSKPFRPQALLEILRAIARHEEALASPRRVEEGTAS